MKEYDEIARNLRAVAQGLYEDGMEQCAKIVFDASNKIDGLSGFLQKERDDAVPHVHKCCKTCCWEYMGYDKIGCPCWNCKGDYSEWAPKEIR